MGRRVVLLCLWLVATAVGAVAQQGVSLWVTPSLELPVGPTAETLDTRTPYSIGASAAIGGAYVLPVASRVHTSAEFAYSALPTHDGITAEVPNLSVIRAGLGLGFAPFDDRKLSVSAAISGGAYLALWHDQQAVDAYGTSSLRFAYQVHPAVDVGVSASYQHFFGPERALYQGVSTQLLFEYHLGAMSRSRLEFQRIDLDPVFPVLYHYFDDHPLGTVSVSNEEKGPIRDVRVSFFVKQYMEDPTLCAEIPELPRGAEKTVPLFALFTDEVMEITEGTRVAGQIIVEYEYSGSTLSNRSSQTVELMYRNALTWDDDNKAAAFVTAKDPAVLRYAKSVSGAIRNSPQRAVSSTFRVAVALFEALRLSGVSYVIDPKSPYEALSQDAFSLDYLQFPSETLAYRAGDCDDLSVLYAALLEAVGVEAAFVTVPGHIFTAFGLEISESEMRRTFSDSGALIVRNGKVWLPVETTALNEGFLMAWDRAARQWREHYESGRAGFYPVHEAWRTYRPVAGPGSDSDIRIPDESGVATRFETLMTRFVEREMSPQIDALRQSIASQQNSVRFVNRLGVLYARYGLYDNAEEEFRLALEQHDYSPARTNLASIKYLRGSYAEALRLYEAVLRSNPNDEAALIGAARTNYELENMETVRELFARVRKVNPEAADRYAYLTGGSTETGRASEAEREEQVSWSEE